MKFVIGLVLGLIIGGVLTTLATGNAGRAVQAQLRERVSESAAGVGEGSPLPSRRGEMSRSDRGGLLGTHWNAAFGRSPGAAGEREAA